MTPLELSLCFLVALCTGAGQVLFKLAARSWTQADLLGNPLAFLLSPTLIAALATYGLSAFAWMFVLRTAPLSRAYVFALTGAALVPFLSWLVFKEPLTPRYMIGFGLLLAGLYVSVGGRPAT